MGIIKPKNSALFSVLSLFLFLISLSLSLGKNIFLSDPSFFDPKQPLLEFMLFSSLVILAASVFFFEKNSTLENLKKFFLFCLPSGIVFAAESLSKTNLPYGIYLAMEIYFFAFGLILFWQKNQYFGNSVKTKRGHPVKQGFILPAIVLLVFALNLSFGTYHIQKFAAVDEPLWLFGRIPKYWEGLLKGNFNNTLVSDKPGITVSILSGTGLFWEDPSRYEPIIWQGKFIPGVKNDYENLFFHFRIPLFLFSSLSLFAFYFFLKKIFDQKTAVFSVIFIGLSPILIGISTIINPDSLLWIFAPLSLFSFLAYLKNKKPSFLSATGIFLGFALLTKYVANILFIFFFGLIFLEYIFKDKKIIPLEKYLRQSISDYLYIIFFAFFIFWFFCPATWNNPKIFIEASLLSQAFRPVLWPFLGIFSALLLDVFLLRTYFSRKILDFFAKNSNHLQKIFLSVFLFSVFLVIANTYSGMKIIDFENFLSSPKSALKNDWGYLPLKTFLSNFYPLVFAISPLTLISLIFGIYISLKDKNSSENFRFAVYIIAFILLYYLGSSVTGVASVIRYQIIIYPMALVVSAFFLSLICEKFNLFQKVSLAWLYLILILLGSFSIFKIAPLYSGYASVLLPKKHFLDVKDMGSGSYEVAEFLNSLPNSKIINVWTDKYGVCYFFKGNCYSGFSTLEIEPKDLDFLVLSSGRESRTSKMSRNVRTSTLDFGKYYDRDDLLVFKLEIDNRPGQFVKIISLKK